MGVSPLIDRSLTSGTCHHASLHVLAIESPFGRIGSGDFREGLNLLEDF
jgi:hypothetical protein